MRQVIKIADYLPETITSRKAIEILRSNFPLSEESSFIFDFSNIDFISRAFADELLHFIAKQNISVVYRNTNPNVDQILKAVQKNRNKRNNLSHRIAVTRFSGKEELNNFLSLI